MNKSDGKIRKSGKGNRINSWYGYGTWEIRRWDEEEQGSDGNETSYEYLWRKWKKNTVGNSITTENWTNVKGETDGVRLEMGRECWTVGGYMLLLRWNTIHAGQQGDTCYYRGGILYMLESRVIHAITEAEYCTCWTVG